MKINFSPSVKNNNISKLNTAKNYSYAPLKADSVQFCGNNGVLSQNIQEGVRFGNELIEITKNSPLTLDILEKQVHNKIPNIKVMPSEELQKYQHDWENYEAMHQSQLNDNFNYENESIFFKIRENLDETERLLSITCAAHEYTHAFQDMNSKEMLNFLKTISKNNADSAKIFVTTGEEIFKYFDTEFQAYSAIEAIKKGECNSRIKDYGQIVPAPAKVSEEDIYKSLGIKDKREFKMLVNEYFNKIFVNIIPALLESNIADEVTKLPNINKPEKLMKMLKEYCRMKALNEYEAYKTESILAHKLTGEDNLTTDIFPIYYKMLADSLKQK